MGYTGTVERLGSDGNTYNMLTLGVGGPEEYLVNIAEMYAPATARFSDVQVVPEGVGLTPFLRSGGSESRPVARGRGQGDWSDHDEQQEAAFPGAGRSQAWAG